MGIEALLAILAGSDLPTYVEVVAGIAVLRWVGRDGTERGALTAALETRLGVALSTARWRLAAGLLGVREDVAREINDATDGAPGHDQALRRRLLETAGVA